MKTRKYFGSVCSKFSGIRVPEKDIMNYIMKDLTSKGWV